MSRGTVLRGRQLGWLVHNWFRLNPDMKQLYSIQDISDIKWMGDDKIFEFLELWKQIVANNAVQLTHKQLATILVQKLPVKSSAIGQDVAYWNRLPEDDPQKSYEYLINSMERHLDRVQMDKNQEARRAALQRGLGTQALGVNPASGGGGGGGAPKRPCYFFNHGGCKNADGKCRFAHVLVPDAEKAKMERPASRSTSPRRGGGGANAASASTGGKLHCFKFLKGTCDKGDNCMFAHIPQEIVNEMNRAQAKAKAKGKATPKPKAKATAVPSQRTLGDFVPSGGASS